jgi:hypothetical protein
MNQHLIFNENNKSYDLNDMRKKLKKGFFLFNFCKLIYIFEKLEKRSTETCIQRFLRSLSGTGTWIKCRFRHKTGTDRNQVILYRQRKVLIMAFFRVALVAPIICSPETGHL